jgi:REP element-mobilizing transposase RayT
MLDHTIPAWAESEATYFITICWRERGKNTLALPDIAKIIFDAAQAYEQRKIWFVRFMLLMPDHLHGIFGIGSIHASLVRKLEEVSFTHAWYLFSARFFRSSIAFR